MPTFASFWSCAPIVSSGASHHCGIDMHKHISIYIHGCVSLALSLSSIYPSIYSSIYLSIDLSIDLSIYIAIYIYGVPFRRSAGVVR